jgi:hypothetical protein
MAFSQENLKEKTRHHILNLESKALEQRNKTQTGELESLA